MVLQQQIFDALAADFDPEDASPEYLSLYKSEPPPINGIFAVVHERLNDHFRFMNSKMNQGRHFNAENSRQLLSLIDAIKEMRKSLKRANIETSIRPDYDDLLAICKSFLLHSGGSPIPAEMPKIEIERFEPVFGTSEWAPETPPTSDRQQLTLVGEGSFALVHKFVDETYGFTVAVKRVKRDVSDRDLARFHKEFELMKKLRFPYIVEAYRYDDIRDSFTMEFCDETLGAYIQREHPNLPWTNRKRIALQFLYGLNFLHQQHILHRDISRNNVLVKHYDSGAVLVKLSDFGLHKDRDSDFTLTATELKGSIIDPALESFKDFKATNDIYAAGVIFSFIFSGKLALGSSEGAIESVVAKATDRDMTARYQTVAELIQAVEKLEPPAPMPSGDAPA